VPNWGQLLGEDGGLPPPRVPGYTILELIGGHGQSEVYLAQDAQGLRVALKRWKLPSPRAQLELEALQSLRVPGVVAVLGSAEDEALGLPCLIMEYVEAPHLLADTERLEPRAAAAVVRDVARTLNAVHARDLVHRDIKPANILLRENGSVILVDFGVVKAGQGPEAQAPLTLTGAGPIGTLPYMAPEQLDLIPEPVGPQADVYALGATLYQCLCGVVPFETNGAFERRERRVWRDPPPGARTEGVPAQLQRVVSACLAFQPQGRPRGVEAVARALDDFLAGRRDRPRLRLPVLAGLALIAVAIAASAVISARPPASLTPEPSPLASLAQAPSPGLSPSTAPLAPLQSLVVQPGPREGRDTYVSSVGLYTNDNFGPAPNLRAGFRGPQTGQVGEYRALLRFDLRRVPREAELLNAQLELSVHGPGFGPGPRRLEARAVVSSGARTPWVEGTGRIDGLLDGVAWSGVARTRLPSASSNFPAFSRPDTSQAASVAIVQSGHAGWIRFELREITQTWVAHPAANLGLEISALGTHAAGHWIFASSDHSDSERWPRLRISYRGAPPEPLPKRTDKDRAPAAAWLRRAAERQEAGDLRAAYDSLTQAAVLAPEWGRPYYERARLAEGLGLKPMVRVDALASLCAREPETRAGALWLLALANVREPGAVSRLMGLVLLSALACEPDLRDAASALFLEAYPPLAAELDLSSPSLRERGIRELLSLSQSLRDVKTDSSGWVALQLAVGLLCETLGDPRALEAFREASRAAPTDSLVLALNSSRERATPRAEAARVRARLLVGQARQAKARWARARSRWPGDSALDALGPLFPR